MKASGTNLLKGRRLNRRFSGLHLALLILFPVLAVSCSMVNEDLPPCSEQPNTITRVHFVYDYNMQYTDLFDRHVGSAYLYVFDEDSVMLFRETKHRADMRAGQIDFTMVFDTTDLKPGKTYHMVAMAQGNRIGLEASMATPGFQVQKDMIPGLSRISDYIIKLDRDEDGYEDFGVVDYKDVYGNNQQMIDTVWSTKPDEVQTVHIPYIQMTPTAEKLPDNEVDVVMPMMRLTNAISVNVVSSSFGVGTDTDIYSLLIYFPSGNGTIDFTGTVYPYQPLYYRTLRKQMVKYNDKKQGDSFDSTKADDDGNTYALQGQFGVSRLQMNDESSFQVRNPDTNEIVAEIPNFSRYLANAFDYYGEQGQEFLDREYNFEVNVSLDENGKIYWMQIGCSILGWSKRIFFYDV